MFVWCRNDTSNCTARWRGHSSNKVATAQENIVMKNGLPGGGGVHGQDNRRMRRGISPTNTCELHCCFYPEVYSDNTPA